VSPEWSTPRAFGVQRSASIKCATACPNPVIYILMLSYQLHLGVANNFFSNFSHRTVLYAHPIPPTNIPLILQGTATKLVNIMLDSPPFNHKFSKRFKFLSGILFRWVNRVFLCCPLFFIFCPHKSFYFIFHQSNRSGDILLKLTLSLLMSYVYTRVYMYIWSSL
jgi:hypothetical protein